MGDSTVILGGLRLHLADVLVANALCLVVGTFVLLNRKREPIKGIHVGLLMFFLALGWLSAIMSVHVPQFYLWILGMAACVLLVQKVTWLLKRVKSRNTP